jgi:hypothetical protein
MKREALTTIAKTRDATVDDVKRAYDLETAKLVGEFLDIRTEEEKKGWI